MAKGYCKTPTIYQMEATECGAASMSMICAYYGKYIPLEQMRIETGVTRDGCNAANIMRAGKRFGMEVHGYRKEPESLRDLPMPCMIHWNFNHFVVLEGFRGKYAYLNDPAVGRRKIALQELDEGFTGVVLTFQPTDSFVKVKKKNQLIPLIKERLSGQKSTLLQLILLGIILIFPGLILPVMSQVFMDEFLGKADVPWFGQFLFFMLCTCLFEVAAAFYRSQVLVRLQNKMAVLSVKSFLERMFRLPVSFFEQRYSGDLTNRVGNNNNVNVVLTGDMAETVLNMIVAFFYLFLLLAYSPELTVIGILGILVNIITAKISSGKISDMIMKMQQDKGKLSGALCAGFGITSTLKACGVEGIYTSRILGFEAKAASKEQEVTRFQTAIGAVPSAISGVTNVALLVIGAGFVIDGRMTFGMLTAFISLYGSFADPVEDLVGIVKKVQILKADMERVNDIMEYPLDEGFTNVENKQVKGAKLSGRVECSGITFGYSKLAQALITDFSFSLDAGSSVAFVGSSGCGKSTVSKMLSGLYQPWEGEICFDGVKISDIPKDVLHVSISTVSQNISLFSGTIRDNLTLWNPAVLEKDMINAAKDACIHEMITEKPGAYDFRLSEGGSNLSGGQRQRLEIARALVTNPTILIMDEATSALDPIVEKKIIDNIKRRGCTCIIVAHRLSAVRNCDEILVMKDGKIIERGGHEELTGMNGVYVELMKMQ